MIQIRIAHWDIVKDYIQEQLDGTHVAMEKAADQQTMWKLIGRAEALRQMLRLEETLSILQVGEGVGK